LYRRWPLFSFEQRTPLKNAFQIAIPTEIPAKKQNQRHDNAVRRDGESQSAKLRMHWGRGVPGTGASGLWRNWEADAYAELE
jgi:hypothetical protein